MRTAKAIVAFVRGQGLGNKVDVDLVDNLLHERAAAPKGQPAEKLEWLLAWAINSVHIAARRLGETAAEDKKRAKDILAAWRTGEPIPSTSRASVASDHRAAMARLEEADATMRRILDVYEVLSVDPPGAE